jgi:hypothetical protein
VKKLIISSGLAVAAVLMLLPVTRPVNAAVGNVRTNGAYLQADGDPLPPPIPPSKGSVGGAYLQADGDPLPPPIPPANGTSVTPYFLSDGDPLPPPIPPTGTALFVAA